MVTAYKASVNVARTRVAIGSGLGWSGSNLNAGAFHQVVA